MVVSTNHKMTVNERLPYIGLGLLLIVGLALVLCYTYTSIKHDMALMADKQPDVFEYFNQRANILDPEQLARFVDESGFKTSIFSSQGADAYVYGYDLNTRRRFAVIPLLQSSSKVLSTFRYVISYPNVINLYTLTDDNQLVGIVADRSKLPDQLMPTTPTLRELAPWRHYFGCRIFAMTREVCSSDEAWVSDIKEPKYGQPKSIAMYFPFRYFDTGGNHYKHGLVVIEIAVDMAFKSVLRPFDELNPTYTAISFKGAVPCEEGSLCLSMPLLHTKARSALYLRWTYSYIDFGMVAFFSPAFQLYVITLLVAFLLGPRIYKRFLTMANTDHLTRLPRRDILDMAMLHAHDYLLILDIDNFKSINDTHGHHVGDNALTAFAQHLRNNIRNGDTAIRWGGEEFIVLYKGSADDEEMRASTNRLLVTPLRLAELPDPITFSGGMIRIRDYMTVNDAIAFADELLFYVKQNGKHNIARHYGMGVRLQRGPAEKVVLLNIAVRQK